MLEGASEANALGEDEKAFFSMSTVEPWPWAARGKVGSIVAVLYGRTTREVRGN